LRGKCEKEGNGAEVVKKETVPFTLSLPEYEGRGRGRRGAKGKMRI